VIGRCRQALTSLNDLPRAHGTRCKAREARDGSRCIGGARRAWARASGSSGSPPPLLRLPSSGSASDEGAPVQAASTAAAARPAGARAGGAPPPAPGASGMVTSTSCRADTPGFRVCAPTNEEPGRLRAAARRAAPLQVTLLGSVPAVKCPLDRHTAARRRATAPLHPPAPGERCALERRSARRRQGPRGPP